MDVRRAVRATRMPFHPIGYSFLHFFFLFVQPPLSGELGERNLCRYLSPNDALTAAVSRVSYDGYRAVLLLYTQAPTDPSGHSGTHQHTFPSRHGSGANELPHWYHPTHRTAPLGCAGAERATSWCSQAV